MTRDWRTAYEQVSTTVLDSAPAARPLLAGFNTCVDHAYRLDPPALDRLTEAARAGHRPLAALSDEVLRRIRDGGDGEVFVPAPQSRPALDELLGPPAARQVGGTGAQAAWVPAVLNAPSVLALADRSAEQLAVLHPGIGLCGDGTVRPVAAVTARGARDLATSWRTAGWRAECVPTPYLSRPAATIGLGDTFVAGVLLAGCLPVKADLPVRLSPGGTP
ncbi:hypothetical protein [Nonomuraea sp. NEAU-A123]|uniref:hypothetical protein n=1 Tax=Nonomuraea sp. NEAU-A123 TaxID=2839649 RepID=UPI001BE3FC06|nr:hypothetical protein [Nonomuraea sp. NEAU-A123]MBT2233172.1 hypothetical protein [Nonomuraea sp. NEAU-A123]